MQMLPCDQATILCVDDQPSGLYCRKLVLEQKGYRVLTATTARKALEIFRENRVDLIITDHLLGRDTGARMAAEMRRLNPHVPILILSGLAEITEGLGAADAFMSKAEGPDELLKRVGAMLERSSEAT